MQPLTSPAPARPRPPASSWLPPALVLASLLALVPVVIVVAGLPFQKAACDQVNGCWASDMEQWISSGFGWISLGVQLGGFIVSAVLVAPWLRVRPALVKGGSIAALCLLVPVGCLLALASVVVWNTQCSAGSMLCVGGHGTALALGAAGAVTGVVSALLVLGLARPETRVGRAVSTATVAGLAAAVIAGLAGTVVGSVLDSIMVALFY